MAPRWHLLFTLPNLVPPDPSPFEAEGVYLCSSSDGRLKALSAGPSTKTARLVLRRHRTTFDNKYKPGCLLVRTDTTEAIRNEEVLRAFRNVCSVATTTRAWAESIAHPYGGNSQWTARWSDSFFLGYHTPGISGALITLRGATQGMNPATRLRKFRALASPQIGLPTNFRVLVDPALLRRLLIAWKRFYLQQRQRTTLRRLFRSLEMAFHAGMFPSDGLRSVNDDGSRIGLWVSAFEVLFHPGSGGNVNKSVVQSALQTVPWQSAALKAKRYRVRRRRHDPHTLPATLAESIYDDLYRARNRFLHGEPVTWRDLLYRRSTEFQRLLVLAPVLYNAALLAFLRSVRIPGGPEEPGLTAQSFNDDFQGIVVVQDALLNARPTNNH